MKPTKCTLAFQRILQFCICWILEELFLCCIGRKDKHNKHSLHGRPHCRLTDSVHSLSVWTVPFLPPFSHFPSLSLCHSLCTKSLYSAFPRYHFLIVPAAPPPCDLYSRYLFNLVRFVISWIAPYSTQKVSTVQRRPIPQLASLASWFGERPPVPRNTLLLTCTHHCIKPTSTRYHAPTIRLHAVT